MEIWDKKSLAVLVGGIIAVLLLVSSVWLAVDCDAFPAWCTTAEGAVFGSQPNSVGQPPSPSNR